jgi:hypothetical protein
VKTSQKLDKKKLTERRIENLSLMSGNCQEGASPSRPQWRWVGTSLARTLGKTRVRGFDFYEKDPRNDRANDTVKPNF